MSQSTFESGVEANQDAGSGAATMTVRPRPSKPKSDCLPPWSVLLHNDDLNDMIDVVVTIRQLTSLSTMQATQCMLEAHTRGLSLLLTTHRERAELLAEQFACKRMTVTIEPAA